MSWLYITPEQGGIVDSICNKFYTGFKVGDCPGCPLAPACKCDGDQLPINEPDRTRRFEEWLWELAEASR